MFDFPNILQSKEAYEKYKQNAINMAMQMVPVAGVQTVPELLPFRAAQPAARIGQAMDRLGNVPIADHETILKLAREYLKIPKRILAKMSTERMIRELRSLINPEQAKMLGGG